MVPSGDSVAKKEKELLVAVFHQGQVHIKLKLKLLILRNQDSSWVRKSKT
jgi:hypothetical protein